MALYIIAIGWLYVALMMSVAEATNTTGTVLGAIITFVLYGALPVALLMYILGTPARRRAHRAKQASVSGKPGTPADALPNDNGGQARSVESPAQEPSGGPPDAR